MRAMHMEEEVSDEPLKISPFRAMGAIVAITFFMVACYAPEAMVSFISM